MIGKAVADGIFGGGTEKGGAETGGIPGGGVVEGFAGFVMLGTFGDTKTGTDVVGDLNVTGSDFKRADPGSEIVERSSS